MRSSQTARRAAQHSQGRAQTGTSISFGALKVAPERPSAKEIENRIWSLWTEANNETTNLLMSRQEGGCDKDYDLAIRMLEFHHRDQSRTSPRRGTGEPPSTS